MSVIEGMSDTCLSEISVEVRQDNTLLSLLFITVMEEPIKKCRTGSPWELLYVDDLILTAEAKKVEKKNLLQASFGEKLKGE